jgi:hypothetical protein
MRLKCLHPGLGITLTSPGIQTEANLSTDNTRITASPFALMKSHSSPKHIGMKVGNAREADLSSAVDSNKGSGMENYNFPSTRSLAAWEPFRARSESL